MLEGRPIRSPDWSSGALGEKPSGPFGNTVIVIKKKVKKMVQKRVVCGGRVRYGDLPLRPPFLRCLVLLVVGEGEL